MTTRDSHIGSNTNTVCPIKSQLIQAVPPPYSCRLLYDEQRKCAFGSCDPRTLDRLKRECLHDDGRP